MRHRSPTYYLTRLRRMALARGGKVLSRAYVDDSTKLLFQCAQGHVWAQAPGAVKGGHWCTECGIVRGAAAHKAPAIARFYRLVARRGGVIVSKAYVNSQTKLRYRCIEGHEWEGVPNGIVQGRWCPVCADKGRAAA